MKIFSGPHSQFEDNHFAFIQTIVLMSWKSNLIKMITRIQLWSPNMRLTLPPPSPPAFSLVHEVACEKIMCLFIKRTSEPRLREHVYYSWACKKCYRRLVMRIKMVSESAQFWKLTRILVTDEGKKRDLSYSKMAIELASAYKYDSTELLSDACTRTLIAYS